MATSRGIPSLDAPVDTTPSAIQTSAAPSAVFDTSATPHTTTGTNANAAASAEATLHLAAGMVIAALILLWMLGGFVFRSVNL